MRKEERYDGNFRPSPKPSPAALRGERPGRTPVLVLGGGQLGRMLGEAAARLDIALTVLDPTPDCPAAATTSRQVHGSFREYDDVLRAAGLGTNADDSSPGREREEMAGRPDAVTVEIESVSVAALDRIAAEGIPVHPAPEVIRVIQDKLAQRRRAEAAGLPVPRFVALPDPTADPEGAAAVLRDFGLPAVQKLRFGGYDGRGVAMLRRREETDGPGGEPGAADLPLAGPSLLEAPVDMDREIAVLVARTPAGECRSYPAVEMEMDPELHLVRAVLYPAEIPDATAEEARRIAEAAVADLNGAGIFAVELFIARDGQVIINEIAPRPHNSGHLTIEAAETDQYEQHLRGILGLPLGSTRMHSAAAMVNLIGTGEEGPTVYHGYEEALAMDGVHLHLYGKHRCRPGRKMGHITAIADTREAARERALRAAEALSVRGRSKH
ncbi:MAG: 5-(carboxyamino)imidazole ribonucleotide synthase [Desulfococcaceae bacterium]